MRFILNFFKLLYRKMWHFWAPIWTFEPQILLTTIRDSPNLAIIWYFPSKLQLEWIGYFYALQWLDGSTIVVAVPKSIPKVGGWEREQLGKTVPQPKGNFLMELTDLPFHGSDLRQKFSSKIENPYVAPLACICIN